jgi:hypothetical protein
MHISKNHGVDCIILILWIAGPNLNADRLIEYLQIYWGLSIPLRKNNGILYQDSLPLFVKYLHQFIIHKYVTSGVTLTNNNRTRTWILKAISKFRGCIRGIKQYFQNMLYHTSIKKGNVLRRITPCGLVKRLHRFWEACCLHFQNNLSFFDCKKQEAPQKYSYMYYKSIKDDILKPGIVRAEFVWWSY